MGVHIAWTHKRRRRNFRRVLVPDGAGWLEGVLRDASGTHTTAGLQLGSLTRFAARLAMRSKPTKQSRRATLGALAVANIACERSPNEPFTFCPKGITMPAHLGRTVLLLAKEGGVTQNAVGVALISYGIEMVARELRAFGALPPVQLPGGNPERNSVPLPRQAPVAGDWAVGPPVT